MKKAAATNTGPTAPDTTATRGGGKRAAPAAGALYTDPVAIRAAAFAAILCCRDKPFGLRTAAEVHTVDQAFRLATGIPSMDLFARELLLAYAEATLAERGIECPGFAHRLPLPLPAAWSRPG